MEIDNSGQFRIYVESGEQSNIPGPGEYLVVTDTSVHSNVSLVDGTSQDNVFIWHKDDRLYISTSSGASFLIGKQLESFLYLISQVSSQFLGSVQGLIGTYDGNPSNDFQLPNGTVLSNTLSEEDIYYNFGLSCKLSYMYS